MSELLDTSYTLGVTFLLISKIIKKNQKFEELETNEITFEMINKYLPEIEKQFPEIRKQLPQLEKFCCDQKNIKHKKPNLYKNYKPHEEKSNHFDYHDFSTKCCETNKHSHNIKYHHKSESYVDKFICHPCICKVCNKDSDSGSSECKFCFKTHKHCENGTTRESDEINDRIKKIKIQLDKLSDTDEELHEEDLECKYDNEEYIKYISDFKCREITDEEEKNVSQWDLCELKKTCNPCKHECGKFAIDEDLHIFKNKVIEKAEIIISCYKNKLLECEENKRHFIKCLEKYKKNNCVIEEKLEKCYCFLKECEEDKNKITYEIKKCKKELAFLFEEYRELEREYKKRKEELEKCHCKNDSLLKELHDIKYRIRKCLHEKNKLKKDINRLHCSLETCDLDKKHLLEIIYNTKVKINKCDCENIKLECIIRELEEEIHRLAKKVKLLICQNKKLQEQDTDLKKQLGKTLTTLKCLCEKYNALKENCIRRKNQNFD